MSDGFSLSSRVGTARASVLLHDLLENRLSVLVPASFLVPPLCAWRPSLWWLNIRL